MLRETVEIVKSMWTEPDATYEGKYFQLDGRAVRPEAGAAAAPADLDRRRRRAAHVAGRRPPRRPLELRRQARRVRAQGEVLKGHCEDVGRDYDEITQDVVARGVHPRDRAGDRRRRQPQSFWGEPFESWRAGNLVGTPEQVAEKMQAYVDLGCTGFVPWCSDYPDTESMRLFAEKVIPELPLTRAAPPLTNWRQYRSLSEPISTPVREVSFQMSGKSWCSPGMPLSCVILGFPNANGPVVLVSSNSAEDARISEPRASRGNVCRHDDRSTEEVVGVLEYLAGVKADPQSQDFAFVRLAE